MKKTGGCVSGGKAKREWKRGGESGEGRGALNCCITIGVYHHHHYSMGSVAKDERKSSLIEEEQIRIEKCNFTIIHLPVSVVSLHCRSSDGCLANASPGSSSTDYVSGKSS